jgi:tellurite resistance protein TerC
MTTSIWGWLGFTAFILALLAFDLGVLHRKRREIGVREALLLSAGYVAIALLFGIGVFWLGGAETGWQFLTGYLIEKSLSLDNIFVIFLIFAYFGVPKAYQHRVLFWGILGAIALRAALIFAGVTLIDRFHWVVFIFGAFLIATGVKMLIAAQAQPDLAKNKIVRLLRRRLRVTETYDGDKFVVRRNGALWATPLLLALVLVEVTDLVFAVDSIPAIIAITQDPFIVFTSNVFAILGLRALYFALASVVPRFRYLKYGLALVLVLIGGKMIVNGWFGEKTIPTEIALLLTALLIGGAMAFSMIKTRKAPPVLAPQDLTGWIPGSPARALPSETAARKKKEISR